MLEPIWEASFADEGATVIGRVKQATLAGHDAAYIDYGHPFGGRADPGGRIICIFLEERGLFIEASAGRDSWEEFLPTLNAMLDSLVFFEPHQ
jgi:hypothetical protein